MNDEIRQYLSTIGRIGGRKSRRKLDSKQAHDMLRIREAKRAFKRFKVSCFWSFDPNYCIGAKDVSWVADQLKRNGNREAWRLAAKLCR